uniref:Uncharacterized protein n=1 Tax=Physcomitrium patens TaxID=3218 RepID=A0A2K1IYM4_PHYPA|nr:hypothetical protein PHYPA_024195 [Physcomitrium patens]
MNSKSFVFSHILVDDAFVLRPFSQENLRITFYVHRVCSLTFMCVSAFLKSVSGFLVGVDSSALKSMFQCENIISHATRQFLLILQMSTYCTHLLKIVIEARRDRARTSMTEELASDNQYYRILISKWGM